MAVLIARDNETTAAIRVNNLENPSSSCLVKARTCTKFRQCIFKTIFSNPIVRWMSRRIDHSNDPITYLYEISIHSECPKIHQTAVIEDESIVVLQTIVASSKSNDYDDQKIHMNRGYCFIFIDRRWGRERSSMVFTWKTMQMYSCFMTLLWNED